MGRLKNTVGKDTLSLDDVCYLVEETYGIDHVGKRVMIESIATMCFCGEMAVTSNEFFKARQNDIRADVTLVLDSESYNNQAWVNYKDVAYVVYRVFQRADGMCELYLAERVGT